MISQLQLWKIDLDFRVMDGIISLCLSYNCQAGMGGRTSFVWVVSGRGSRTDSSSSGVRETCCGPPSHSSQWSSSFLNDEGLWKPATKTCKVSIPLSLQYTYYVKYIVIFTARTVLKSILISLSLTAKMNEWTYNLCSCTCVTGVTILGCHILES